MNSSNKKQTSCEKKNEDNLNDSIEMDEDTDNKNSKDANFKKRKPTMSYDMLRLWSRKLHKNSPPNPFYKQKIPYKTILIVYTLLN